MAKSRASKGLLVTPRATPNESEARREKWLAEAEAEFASPSPTNKLYYSVILRALWPAEHGIPGPVLTEKDVRAAVDAFGSQTMSSPTKTSSAVCESCKAKKALLRSEKKALATNCRAWMSARNASRELN